MSTQPDKIWAISRAPGGSLVPVHVNRRVRDSDAWKIHEMEEVGDPTLEPQPFKTTGRPTKAESVTIERLRKEKEAADKATADLQAKFDALAAEMEASKKPEPVKA
jgi:hypothetical protein